MQVITDAIMLDEDGAWALMPNPCGSPVTPGRLSPGPPGLPYTMLHCSPTSAAHTTHACGPTRDLHIGQSLW